VGGREGGREGRMSEKTEMGVYKKGGKEGGREGGREDVPGLSLSVLWLQVRCVLGHVNQMNRAGGA